MMDSLSKNKSRAEGLKAATYHAPPQCVSIAREVGLCSGFRFGTGVVLRQVDEVGGEDKSKETDVKRCDEFLGKK